MTSNLIAAFLVGAAVGAMLVDMAHTTPPPGPIRMDPSETRPDHPYGDPQWGGAKYPGCRGRRPQWLWDEWCGSAANFWEMPDAPV